MSNKARNQFESLMKNSDQISENSWKVTTAKRITLVIPEGVRLFDTDLNKYFDGDGITSGGTTVSQKLKIRKVPIAAAAGAGLSAATSGSTNSITWTTYGDDIRTGDSIILAAGSGTLPSGLSATTYYVIKNGDVNGSEGESNSGTSFKVATTRANALAETAVSILSSGVPGWTAVIAGVAVQPCDDVLLIDPVSAAVSVILPDASSAITGANFTIKRAKTATNDVTIVEADASGNISASGSVVIDDTTGYVVLKNATNDFIQLFADSSVGEYWSIAKQVTP